MTPAREPMPEYTRNGLVGVVLAAWYMLRLYQGLMNGEPSGEDSAEIASTQMVVLVPLASLAVVIGVYPAPLLDLLGRGVAQLLPT